VRLNGRQRGNQRGQCDRKSNRAVAKVIKINNKKKKNRKCNETTK